MKMAIDVAGCCLRQTFSAILGLHLLIMAFVGVRCQEFTTKPQTVAAIRGSNVTFECQVTKLGGSNVFWLHKRNVLSVNQLVMRTDNRTYIRGRYSLLVTNVTSQDEGEYVCQLSTVPVLEQVSTLIVQVPAEINQFPETPEVETTLGETVNFTCGATGKPSPNITWTREDEGWLPSGKETVEGSTLMLRNIRFDQDGKYRCTAYNGVGPPDTDTVHLKVYYPPIIHNQTSIIHTGPGAETYLPCVVSAQPEPTVTWYHNETKLGLRDLPQHKEIVVDNQGQATDYQLHIRGVKDSDLGTYVCAVTNDKGATSTEIRLTAMPDRPVITSNPMGDYSDVYTVEWSVVSYIVPVHYIVMMKKVENTTADMLGEWKEVKAEPTTSGNPSSGVLHGSVRLSNLMHDTSYEVVVKAYNAYGWGERSEHFSFTTNKGTNDGTVTRVSAVLIGWLFFCAYAMVGSW